MQINAIIYEAINDRTLKQEVEIPADATVQAFIDALGYPCGDLTNYYPFTRSYIFDDEFLPFLISEGAIRYSVPLPNAKLADFMNTLGIKDNSIRITTNYPMAGGFGIEDLPELWETVYKCMEGIAVFCSISGFSLRNLWNWLKGLFVKRDQTPFTVMDVIYSRTAWNHMELARLLDIDVERAKELLRAFGYEYERSAMQFVQNEHIDIIKDKLLHIENLH